MYVRLRSHTSSVEARKLEKTAKAGAEEKSEKIQKKERQVEDGLLLVVSASIYGKPIRALIDSGATRCFVTPTCVAAVGLKGTPRDVFPELRNGGKYLSREYVPEVPVVTAGLT